MIDETFKQINILRSVAEYQDYKEGIGRYKWELGIDVLCELQTSLMEFVRYKNGDIETTGRELMGIPIDRNPNYEEPNLIRLWREVSIK